jgi:vacuolar-type H+-ATPase subunit I/STV1
MKQLSPEQVARKEKLLEEIADVESELNGEIDEFNKEVEQLFKDTVERKEKELNEKLKALKDFCDEVANEASDHYDEQDEDWQASDEGSKYDEWKKAFEAAADIADVEVEKPEEIQNVEVDLLGVDNISDEFDG